MLAFLLLIFCVCLCSTANSSFEKILFLSAGGEVSFYLENYQEIEGCETIKNGAGCVIKTDVENAKKINKKINNCSGFSIEFYSENISDFLNEINIIKIEKISDLTIYYGYFNGLINSINIENKKINIQIAINNEKIVIGSPIILGDY